MTNQQQPTKTKKMRSHDTAWYLLLDKMQNADIHVTREWFKTLIKKICDAAGIKRADYGLITGARADFYFDGGWQSVSFEAIIELAAKGTDIIFIEKQGIIDELKEFADKYGIAMVNSRGYLTEYAHDLIKAAKISGANIILITDYDLSGINLASKCDESVYYITMDDSTLDYFGLPKDERIVVDATNKGLIKTVKKIVQIDSRFANVDINFLKQSRIEINAVLAQVGDERFSNFLMDKIGERFPTRNYNRAIPPPSKDEDADEIDLYPKGMKRLIKYYRDKVSEIVEDEEAQIVKEQEKVQGFLDVAEQKKKNKERVMKVIAEDQDINKIESRVAELCDSLGIDNDNDKNKGC
jgi:hypothetical protein